jgi:hypothetical protein
MSKRVLGSIGEYENPFLRIIYGEPYRAVAFYKHFLTVFRRRLFGISPFQIIRKIA